MKNIWKIIIRIKPLVPQWLITFIKRHWATPSYNKYMWEKSDPFHGLEPLSARETNTSHTLGIIKEFAHNHVYYVAACLELKVPYKLIDISTTDWIEKVQESQCDAFLVWPSPVLTIWKEMYDERIKIMAEELGKIVYPSYNEVWLYESKRRVRDWLVANNIKHPATSIFYDLDQAIDFLEKETFPIVLKSNFGGSASGVVILKNIKDAKRKVRRAFNRGIVAGRRDFRDRQWGSVILQEYIPNAKEWRMVRVGDYYFCRLKQKKGEFASGSGLVDWAKPSLDLLELSRHITTLGNFTSMNVDFFEDHIGQYLANELHPFFGAIKSQNEKRLNNYTGRYIYQNEENRWIFEKGYFYQNACANLRVEYLLKKLSND